MAEGKSLKSEAFSGAKWTTAASVTTTLTRFFQIAVLARLLRPEDFGLVGMVMIVIGFAQVFSDAGVSAAIVQRQRVTPGQLSSLYWLNIFSGVAVFAALLCVTPVAVSFFGYEELRGLFHLASLLFLIIPFGQQFQFLLQKELKFDTISKIDVTATLIDAGASVAAAAAGAGAVSIILGHLCGASARAALLFARGMKFHRPSLRFRTSDLRGFVSFGLYQMGEKSLNYFQGNVDNLLIGKILGPKQLGYYTIAFNLIIQPVSRINPIINRVVFPLYAKVQADTERLRRGFFLTLKYLTLINFPLLIGLAVVARPFVITVYGREWAPCVPVIQILAFVGMMKARGNPIGSLILSKGRADLGFKWTLIVAVCNTAAVYLVVGRGIVAVAAMLVFLGSVYFLISYQFLTRPLIGKCAKEIYIDNFLVPLSYSLVMGAFVYILMRILPLDDLRLLITGVLAGAAAYLAIIAVFEKDTVAEFRKNLSGRGSP